MVYIEITAIIIFCIVSYYSLKKLYNKKLDELDQHHRESIKELEKWVHDVRKEMGIKQDKALISAKYEVSKENKLYLSQINEDISFKVKELADIVQNRKII